MNEDVKFERSSGNVFEDLGIENPDQELLKAKLAFFVHEAIQEKKLTQEKAASLMGITQPDISKLKHGQYSRFTAERLFKFLNRLDYDVDITISKATDHEPRLNIAAQ